MKKFFKKYWKAIFIIFWYVFCCAALIIFCSLEVFASEPPSYFPMGQDDNGVIDPWIVSYVENTYDTENNNVIIKGPNYISNYEQYFIAIIPRVDGSALYGELYSNGYQWSLYNIGSATVTYREVKIQKPQYWYWDNDDFSHYYTWTGSYSSLYDSSIGYVSNFRLYNVNDPEIRKVVLKYGYAPPDYFHGDGHAIPPDLDSPEYPTGATIPDRVPQFHTWNTYTWNTYNAPNFDTSSLESMVESLGDIVTYNAEYLADGIGGSIGNLGTNLKNYIEDLGNIMKYYGDLINKNLKKFADNIYDNFKELLEPIYAVVDLFVKPWDAQEFQQQLNESAFYGSLDTTITQIRSFGTSLTNATEPENLSFSINLTGIGWGTSEIDFNWIKPFRNIIRLIIGCVLVYWLIIEIITGINNVIGSGGDNEE